MKKRKWQKAAALIACVTMVATTPNITNVVNGSAYDDENIADFISAEDSGADNSWNGSEDFSQNENGQAPDSVDFISGFSSEDSLSLEEGGSEENRETGAEEIQEAENREEEKAWVTLEAAGETRRAEQDQNTEYQWIHVSSEVSQGEAAAKVRLYLKEHETETPAKVLKAALSATLPENLSEAAVTDWMKLNTPVVLENVRADGEKLPVTYVQEYLRDENGEYLTDENGNLTVISQYLEYELPSQGSADFYVALAYSTAETEYLYQADLIPQVTAEVNGERTDILEKTDDSKFSVIWKPAENQEEVPQEPTEEESQKDGEDADTPAEENPGNGEDSEIPAEDEKQEAGDGDQAPAADTSSDNGSSTEETKEALVRISLTKELEDVCSNEEVSDEGTSEETAQEEAEDGIEMIPETDASGEDSTQTEEPQEAEEKTAVSGQTYAVHVTAQDLHEDSSGDITVKLHLKDSETGLPITGISTGFGKTKEEALAGEAASLMEIPAGLPDQSLTVSRVQESTTEENGDTQVTADYITFQLPAGSTADFYIGITYTAQEEEYSQTLAMEAEAQQLVAEKVQSPQEETEVQPEAKPQPETSSEENKPEAEPQPETSSEESQPEAEPQPETGSEENKPEAEAQPETGSEGPQSEAELQADFQSETQPEEVLFALPGALETQVGEGLDEPEEIPTVEETGETESAVAATDSQGTTPDADSTDEGSEGEKKLVNVLDGTAVVMLAWAAKAADGGNRPLKAGDWLYFDVTTSKPSNGGDHWYEARANLFLEYGADNDKKLEELKPCKEKPHWYRVKITPEMVTCDKFWFVRRDPDNTKEWGRVPRDSSLSFTNNDSSNVFRMTNYDNGAWVSGEWYTISYAGEELYFFNMKGSQELTAEFSVANDTSQVEPRGMALESGNSNLYSVTIPEGAYDTVTFKDRAGSTLATAKILDDAYDPETTNTYYYAASEIEGNIHSTWGICPEKTGKIAGKKLYLDNETGAFPTTGGEVKIQIGNGSQETLSIDNAESKMYLYTVPENSEATQQTIITLTKGNNIYRLLWGNLKKNKVTVTDNIANVAANYRTDYTVYYDATLSKMSYKGSIDRNDGKGIPYDDESLVYYYAVTKNGTVKSGNLQRDSKNQNLWLINLTPQNSEGEYTQIRFAGYNVTDAKVAENGDATDLVDIPWELDNPCYYGDGSDDVIYKGGNRGGYWDEKGSVRDAGSGKNQTVVDIASGSFTRKSDTLYVDSTFYDYYTDYELNGNNRDNYNNSDNSGSQRNWVTFRQFDQALSDYYKSRGVAIPIYIGHFQPSIGDWGNKFEAIAGTLNLYGYDNYNNFFSTNNSAIDINGNTNNEYFRIAKGLVKGTLASGNLPYTSSGETVLPLFDEGFLLGNNSKNTVIGNVYHDVAFPFTQKDIDHNGVKYWVFDSKDTTLLMTQDSGTGEYYLRNPGTLAENCKNLNSKSDQEDAHGFFPFNEGAAVGKANTYNYGFGSKLEFNFRLTSDGQVKNNEGNDVPIEFKFSGDDDVWVFIDGRLALDVGGAHSPATGTLNFATMEATVSSVKASAGNSKPTTVTKFGLEGDKTSEHTLTMFYMERGMWESNMRITFNFPDENQLQVEKRVDKSEVNSLFTKLFEDTSLFSFYIRNLATHYAATPVKTSGQTDPVTLSDYKVESSNPANTFELSSQQESQLHWFAKENDETSVYRGQRYGKMELNSALDISSMAYLEFKFYYDYTDTPSLANMYLQLVDSSGKIAGNINNSESLSGRTYGSVTPTAKQWTTVKLDLTKLSWSEGFNKSSLKKICFGYNYPRDIYLKDFVFQPAATYTKPAGFITKQYDIPDYGSATSGGLKFPAGAIYTSSKGGTYSIGTDGTFVLKDKETITFNDQFRRGSYISLKEDADPNLFDTTWTMYENGQAVTSMGTGGTVTNGSVTSLSNVSGATVEDGRTEVLSSGTDSEGKVLNLENYYDGKKPSENTFVFRSYSNPDNTTSTTKLKAVFYNKVKTGSLKLTKLVAYPSDKSALAGEKFKFKITFTNVGGMGLEEKPITIENIELGIGETREIHGIPIGTFFSIEEVKTNDGTSVDSILLKSGTVQQSGTNVVKGEITNTEAEVVFKNTKKPLVDISVSKEWKNQNGETYSGDFPEQIYVQLQRSTEGSDNWEAVNYNGFYTEIAKNIYTNKWECAFTDLDEFVDYTATPQVRWSYRVVEGTVNVAKVFTPVPSGNINLPTGEFTVTYRDGENGTKVITNTYQPPKTNIQLLKIKAGTAENPEKLKGATFSIEKLLESGDVDSSFKKVEGTTGDDGLVVFEDLADGTYRITEVKAPEGYNLLKSPITVILNRKESSIKVNEEEVIEKLDGDTITIQVADQKKFDLPATGSWSRLILGFGGGILIGMAVIMYLLQKRRKGVKTS